MYLNEKLPELESPLKLDEFAQRRVALIEALRHPTMWPRDFYWDFNSCSTCGAGLARALKLVPPRGDDYCWLPGVTRAMGLTEKQATIVFVRGAHCEGSHEITPNHIADRLESVHREILETLR